MFNFIKKNLQKVYSSFTHKIQSIFSKPIDEQTLKELEILLISADVGVKTTKSIINDLKEQFRQGSITQGDDLKQALEKHLLTILQKKQAPKDCAVYVLVGINGSGKTTFAGKLAYKYAQEGKKVLLAACDTFRAAAPEQLQQWAEKTGADIVIGKQNQDPASVVFTACEKYTQEEYDVLIIDTAGRLQTKINLMNELSKIKRVIEKKLPNQAICTLLTVDAMLGQNSFEQARLFDESTKLDGIVLTKMDGTGKGGIVFAITQTLGIPVAYISFGEQPDQCTAFDPEKYVQSLMSD